VRLGVARVLLGRGLDQTARPLDVAHLVECAPDQEEVAGVLVRTLGDLLEHPLGFVAFSLAHQRVELEQQRVDHLLVDLGEIEGLIAHADRLVEISDWSDEHLGRVEHRLEVGLVERDGLLVGLDRLLALTLHRRDEPQQVVRLRRVGIELERAARRGRRPARVAPLHELPSPIEVRRELIHLAR
jgi:hypothetical protein